MAHFEIPNEMLKEFSQSVSAYLCGIDKIEYKNKNESHIMKKERPCSVLEIYVSKKSEYQKLKLDSENNWNDDFPFTKEIKSVWNSLLRKHKTLDENDTKIGYVFFHCTESNVKYEIAYHSKQEIQTALEKKHLRLFQLPKIKHLFCSTQLEYTIVLANEKDYKCYETFGLNKIKEVILSVLNEKIKNQGYDYIFSENDFKCQLLHLDMRNVNLFWLSRED